LIKLLQHKFVFKFKYIHVYLQRLLSFNTYSHKEENYYIIDKFLERETIEPEEYNIDYEKYNKLDCKFILNYCKETNKIYFDKIYFKNFLVKLNLVNEFICNHTENLMNVIYIKFDDYNEFTKLIEIDANIIKQYNLQSKYFWFNIFDLILTDFYEIFKNKLNSLDEKKFSTFIIVIFNIFCIIGDLKYFLKFEKDFEDIYNTKFDNLVNKIKNIRNKINLKNILGTSTHNRNKILKYFVVNNIYIDDINNNYRDIYESDFIIYYKGEYNTELLNRCIKYNFSSKIIEYLLKEKNILFDKDTIVYSIYNENIDVIKYLLDNKYPASDKDLLYCTTSTFLKQMCEEYKKYNILVSDDIFREIYFKIYSFQIPKEYCVNGDNDEHMEKLIADCDEGFKKIFPFDMYHKNIDYIFYYDQAKRGELTLDNILKIHHVVGAEGIKELLRFYMEFNKLSQPQETQTQTQLYNPTNPTNPTNSTNPNNPSNSTNSTNPNNPTNPEKKIVKKVIKKVIKKVFKKL
jgi:hypothetical protein